MIEILPSHLATRSFSREIEELTPSLPVDFCYNPLEYARDVHEAYLSAFGRGRKRVLFLGMNPGPYGMAQTGVPFGEVCAVRDWMGLRGHVGRPPREHPAKSVTGFACRRNEVSGARLWGLFAEVFRTPEAFFSEHFVHSYCPLLFLKNTPMGRNLTPEELPAAATAALFALCDGHLRERVAQLESEVVVGVGGFARRRAESALAGTGVRVAGVAHPSPANPGANGDWSGRARLALAGADVWPA